MKDLRVLAITHKKAELSQVGRFHLQPDQAADTLRQLKLALQWDELMYLSTCNRVEFIYTSQGSSNHEELTNLVSQLLHEEGDEWTGLFESYEGENAIQHIFEVASSVDSLVLGEREIITQFRQAFEWSKNQGLSGDSIRLLARQTIETAKQIFTETQLCTRPVSVVSLAFKALQDHKRSTQSRILIIGAGTTNRNMARFLVKAGYRNVSVFNRSLENAQHLASLFGDKAKAHTLKDLASFTNGFDILISCTASTHHIIDSELYQGLVQGELTEKLLIDLAIPQDIDPKIQQIYPVKLIDIASLKPISEANLKARSAELVQCKAIIEQNLNKFKRMAKERKVELAMKQVPVLVREIKQKAVSEVFAKDLAQLDDNSKDVLLRMMDYVEKKYISGPIKLAKEILLTENS